MKLKSYIRNRLIEAVKFAVREEMQNQKMGYIEGNAESQDTEEIISRLDKQIERWTWERYKRTNKLFDEFEFELGYEINKGIDRLGRKVSMSADDAQKKYIGNVDEKVKYWTAKRFEQTDKR